MFFAKYKDKEDLEQLAEQEQKLPAEIEEKKRKGTLRTGYTAGTTATAATKGALYALITGRPKEQVTVSLPRGEMATTPVSIYNLLFISSGPFSIAGVALPTGLFIVIPRIARLIIKYRIRKRLSFFK